MLVCRFFEDGFSLVDTLTIVMPVRDGEKYIEQAFASIAQQDLTGVNLIIVDDGSEDRTHEYCEHFLKQHVLPTKIIYSPHRRPGASRNEAIKLVSTALITFLDQDDLWPEDRISIHRSLLKRYSSVDVITGKTQIFTMDESGLHGHVAKLDNLSASTFRMEVFKQTGLLNQQTTYYEDVEYMLRLRAANTAIYYDDSVSLLYRQHETNMTKNKTPKEMNVFSVIRQSIHNQQQASK